MARSQPQYTYVGPEPTEGAAPRGLPVKLTAGMAGMFLYWSAVAALSFLELARVDTELDALGWTCLTVVAPGVALLAWGVAIAHTWRGHGGCFTEITHLLQGYDGWHPLVLQWLVYVASTGITALQFLALYLRYSEAELELLRTQRWHFARSPDLDPVLVSQWQMLHVLSLTTWVVLTSSLLVVHIHVTLLRR